MTNRDAENPFQSPVSADAVELREYPIGLFGGINAFLILVCAGLWFFEPGLGILAGLLVGPSLLRGVVHIYRGRKCGEAIVKPVSLILNSLLLMIPILLATVVAFGISCVAVSWTMSTLVDFLPFRDGFAELVFLGFPVGLICGAITFVVLFLLTMPPRIADQPLFDEFDR
ncbi:MAG: hypothetical protein WDZ51_12730 [Pirellulaceae bacterium]